jgi:hypothetical protein
MRQKFLSLLASLPSDPVGRDRVMRGFWLGERAKDEVRVIALESARAARTPR